MNLLLFSEDELAGNLLVLQGRRANHLLQVLKVQQGDSVRVGMIHGATGEGLVVTIEKDQVTLEVSLGSIPSTPQQIDLILALPRPIMLQRILKQATVLGVRRFYLIRSRRVEKSYFQSPVLKPEKIREILLEAMEQGMDTWMPQVSIHKQFKPFAQDILPGLSDKTRLIAHPGVADALIDVQPPKTQMRSILLAVGPEGGWNDFELDMFGEQGFVPFNMGKRILHVDTAVVALLAQLQLLYDLTRR